jgi:hypothetical protein
MSLLHRKAYTLESISSISWILGKTLYPKGFIPDEALAKSADKQGHQVGKDSKDELTELEDSQFGKEMPECIRERLEFM